MKTIAAARGQLCGATAFAATLTGFACGHTLLCALRFVVHALSAACDERRHSRLMCAGSGWNAAETGAPLAARRRNGGVSG
jgi:hypothetical protein